MTSIISVKNLKKTYQQRTVVDNLSFDVEEGSLFSFLGPNGAGKSTTINIICTVLKSSSGEVFIDGLDVRKHSQDIRKKIGVVYQHNVLDNLLTVSENLRFRASLYGIIGNEFENRLEEVANQLDFKNYLNQPFHTLSGGQKRRVEIARAIFHEPKILLLDEPTTGLDPESRKTVWEIIGTLKNNFGMTIFLGSIISVVGKTTVEIIELFECRQKVP
jgi:multidrug/hemolysin transport system ATP-binding protein